MCRSSLAVALCALALPAFAAQGPPAALPPRDAAEAQRDALDALAAAVVARGAPGVSLAVALPDGRVLTAVAGYADFEAGRRMRPEDRLLTGSVGKTYVAAAAARLAARGELDLAQRVAAHLGEEAWFPRLPNAESMTVRHLLRHESGLERYELDPAFWQALVAEPARMWKPEEELARLAGRAPLFAAGEGFGYADSNYVALGLVLERVTAQPIDAHIAEVFLAPLGLRDTVPSDTRRIPGLTQGYCRALASLGVPERVLVDGEFVIHPGFEGCGGGYASTASDLARWARALWSGAAIPGEAELPLILDAVPAEALLGRGARYGLGVIVRPSALGPAHGHDGIMTGFQASCAWFPEHGLAAAALVNTDDARAVGRPLFQVVVEAARAARPAPEPPR